MKNTSSEPYLNFVTGRRAKRGVPIYNPQFRDQGEGMTGRRVKRGDQTTLKPERERQKTVQAKQELTANKNIYRWCSCGKEVLSNVNAIHWWTAVVGRARYKELESFDICENVDHIHLLGITEHLELNRGKGRWKIRKELTP